VRSLLAGGTVLLEYCLLLVVVTFNLGLLLSAVLGVGLGALAFGERRAKGRLAAAALHAGRATGAVVPAATKSSC
jgi:UPF0716 family protein affecting phage T7 exclusion